MAEYVPYKKPGMIIDYTAFQLEELEKCANDPIYFMKNYWTVQHPTKGNLPFDLYPYQERMVEAYQKHRFNINMLMRQGGKTTVASAYIAWYVHFNPEPVTVLVTANKLSQAIEIVDRIKAGYEKLPDWLRAGAVEYNKQKITFDNESKIVARATTKDSGRGLSVSLLYCDELAYVPPTIAKEFTAAILPVLSTGGKMIVTSTPRTDVDEFSTLWKGAIDNTDEYGNFIDDGVGKNGFYAYSAIWSDHPDRQGEEWAGPWREKLGAARFAQEFENMFVTDEETLIDSTFLTTIKTDPPEYYTEDGRVRWFKDPEPNKAYLIGFDPAAGTGRDSAGIQVYAVADGVMEQVAEFQHNKTIQKIQIRILLRIMQNVYETLRAHPDQESEPEIFWTFEANGVGEGIGNMVEEEEELFYGTIVNERRRSGIAGKIVRRGLWTDTRRKMNACMRFKSLVETGKIIIHSEGLLRELKEYTRTGSKFEAKSGCHDDLVSSTLLCVRMLDTVIDMSELAAEMRESLEDGDDEPLPIIL